MKADESIPHGQAYGSDDQLLLLNVRDFVIQQRIRPHLLDRADHNHVSSAENRIVAVTWQALTARVHSLPFSLPR